MTAPLFDPPHREMGRHIATGILSSGFSQVGKVAGQIISVVVLSRLLTPSDFGIVAMDSAVSAFVSIILDLGFSQATVQKSTFTHEEANTLFWINTGVGAALALLMIAVSPLVGWYYKEPRTIALTAAMGSLILIGALGNQHTAILTRRMQFKALSIIGMLSTVGFLVVSIGTALLFHSYWALFAGMAASSIVAIASVWVASGWRPSAPRLVSNTRDLLRFGAGITSANIANYFAGNMDNVLIGRYWGDHPLGLYDRAYKLLLFPLQRVVGPVMGTMVPVLSRLTDNPDHYRAIFFKALGQTVLIAWPGIVWAVILADTLVPLLLGKQWAAAAPIFQLLAFAGVMQCVNYFSTCLLVSQGRTHEIATYAIINAVTSVAAFVIGLPFGPAGVAAAFAIKEVIGTAPFWHYITKRGPVRVKDVLATILPQMIGSVAAALVLLGYWAWVDLPPIPFLAIGLILAYGVTALTMMLSASGRATLAHSIAAARKMMDHMGLTRKA